MQPQQQRSTAIYWEHVCVYGCGCGFECGGAKQVEVQMNDWHPGDLPGWHTAAGQDEFFRMGVIAFFCISQLQETCCLQGKNLFTPLRSSYSRFCKWTPEKISEWKNDFRFSWKLFYYSKLAFIFQKKNAKYFNGIWIATKVNCVITIFTFNI